MGGWVAARVVRFRVFLDLSSYRTHTHTHRWRYGGCGRSRTSWMWATELEASRAAVGREAGIQSKKRQLYSVKTKDRLRIALQTAFLLFG